MSDITIVRTLTSTVAPSTTSTPKAYVTTIVLLSTILGQTISSVEPSTSSSSTSSSTSSKSTVASATSSMATAAPDLVSVTSNSDNSLKIGLAVGIPVAIIVLFGLAAAAFLMMKKRKFANTPEKRPYDDLEKFGSNSTLYRESETVTANKSASIDFSKAGPPASQYLERTLSPVNPAPNKRHSVQRFFSDRLSKYWDTDAVMPLPILSPMLLKKFRLTKNEPRPPSNKRNKYDLKLPVVTSDQYMVTRAYDKVLSDEVSITPGDIVTIIKEYSDSWCQVSLKSGDSGFVPKTCLKKVDGETK